MLGFRRKHDQTPTIVQVAKSLVSDALRLARVELDLVKARFSLMLKRTGIAVGILLAAAFAATLGLVGLLVTVGIALAIVLPAWAAALIVAGALVLGGAATGALGVRQLRAARQARTHGPPEIETELQETRYRLEAELDALTSKLDPRHRTSNGHVQTLRTPG